MKGGSSFTNTPEDDSTASTDISPENEEYIRQAVADGRFESRQQALDQAIGLLREDADTLAAIQEGLDSVEQGEGIPLSEADAMLRKKHNIPQDA